MRKPSVVEVGCVVVILLIMGVTGYILLREEPKGLIAEKAVTVVTAVAKVSAETGNQQVVEQSIVTAVASNVEASVETSNSNEVSQVQQAQKEVQIGKNGSAVVMVTVANKRQRQEELKKKIAAAMAQSR